MKVNNKYFLFLLLLLLNWNASAGQSAEVMVGHEYVFADLQWLKFIDTQKHWSLFSRTRATVDYDNQSDVFTGAYLNYSLANGLGTSIVGKIGSSGGAADTGIHFFKARPTFMFFGLASVGLKKKTEYSWFSIFRFTPPINDQWKGYTSLELYHLFAQKEHLVSVQRIRLGLAYHQFQFGGAANFTEWSTNWLFSSNFGLFFRKSF